eukprot:EC124744.1.p1 GENE.EC124744.1~~EC124744.1.p1  ORF type:complete len:174 (+),score=9.31 EC124744.1:142-663(+)
MLRLASRFRNAYVPLTAKTPAHTVQGIASGVFQDNTQSNKSARRPEDAAGDSLPRVLQSQLSQTTVSDSALVNECGVVVTDHVETSRRMTMSSEAASFHVDVDTGRNEPCDAANVAEQVLRSDCTAETRVDDMDMEKLVITEMTQRMDDECPIVETEALKGKHGMSSPSGTVL